MDERQWLAERFEEQRPRVRAVAYRMLGSLGEAEDAVQEAWLRLSGAAYAEVDDVEVQRSVVDAFVAAARYGDFQGLVAVLDPDVVLRGDAGATLAGRSLELRGAEKVARSAQSYSHLNRLRLPVLVNGTAGW